jgi:hypothetical protein
MKYKSCGSYYKISRINLEETLSDKRANYILQKTIRMEMKVWTLLYIVEDNKDRRRKHGLSQMKGEDYMHLYMKQGLGGS